MGGRTAKPKISPRNDLERSRGRNRRPGGGTSDLASERFERRRRKGGLADVGFHVGTVRSGSLEWEERRRLGGMEGGWVGEWVGITTGTHGSRYSHSSLFTPSMRDGILLQCTAKTTWRCRKARLSECNGAGALQVDAWNNTQSVCASPLGSLHDGLAPSPAVIPQPAVRPLTSVAHATSLSFPRPAAHEPEQSRDIRAYRAMSA